MLKVHSYESMGTFDGPGLRFVVFLQGCNFKCLYCANPDTIELKGGMEIHPDEIHRMVTDMRPFFGKRGGVTFSGGEPTLQAEALIPLVERFNRDGIHVCIDTNGSVWNKDVEKLFTLADLVMLDVKQANNLRHKDLTAHQNTKTLNTAKWLQDNNKPFWLRYVLVPTISDDVEDIKLLGETLGGYNMISRVEILPYHRLGVHKYEVMGMEYKLSDITENTPEQLTAAEELLSRYFSNVVVC